MRVKVEKINENAILPTRGSDLAAGYDLYACLSEKVEILPQATYLVPTGLKMEIEANTVALIFARSGLATKQGLAPANKVGVVDADYRGEWMVPIFNQSQVTQVIEPGQRIAQMVVVPFIECDFCEEKMSDSMRGEDGFGSTGK